MEKHSHGGEEIYPPRTNKAGNRGKLSLPIPLSLSLLLCNLNFFPSSHSCSTSTSGFISASRCRLWQPNSFARVEAPVIWAVDNSTQTVHQQWVWNDHPSIFGKCKHCASNPLAMRPMLYYMNINMKTACGGMRSLVCLLIALTPLPDCINNNQRGRLNIYEVYTALVRIQSRLSL